MNFKAIKEAVIVIAVITIAGCASLPHDVAHEFTPATQSDEDNYRDKKE